MHFNATSIGYAVPRMDFDVTVHSVFRSAVNLRLVGDNMLLTLLTFSETDLPQGILINTPNGFSFEGLSLGTQGICRGGVLNLDNSLSIDLRNARCWECNLPALNADMTNPTCVSAWRCVWQALNDRQICFGAEIVAEDLFCSSAKKQSVLIQRLSKSFRNILKMARQFDLADKGAIRALVGLGSGLTPCGDDLLTGYMAGLWCTTSGGSERLNFLSKFGDVVIQLSKGTNDISRTYLYHAACGQVSSRLFNLAKAICNGSDPQSVRDCAKSAMQVGHTSGMDALTGLLFGLAVWDNLHIVNSISSSQLQEMMLSKS